VTEVSVSGAGIGLPGVGFCLLDLVSRLPRARPQVLVLGAFGIEEDDFVREVKWRLSRKRSAWVRCRPRLVFIRSGGT
jgi:hypothetical protein